MPTLLLVDFASARASVLGVYPIRLMASRTTCLVSGLTKRVPFNTCETVDVETPATRATSAIVAMKFASLTSRNARGGLALFFVPPSRTQTKRMTLRLSWTNGPARMRAETRA